MGENLEIASKGYLSPFGMTRAEKLLIMTRAESTMQAGRMQFQNESRFISEIDSKYITFK